MWVQVLKSIDSFDLPGAAEAALDLLRAVDAYIGATEPFQLAKQPGKAAELAAILYQCIEAIRISGVRAL
jgi:methionyl-tRNA synthetase